MVEEAEHGTLFIDEVDSLPMPCQVKLLRFVQEKEYRRLGEARLRKADVRFIAATNADLLATVRDLQGDLDGALEFLQRAHDILARIRADADLEEVNYRIEQTKRKKTDR